jgi:hypothetical protein
MTKEFDSSNISVKKDLLTLQYHYLLDCLNPKDDDLKISLVDGIAFENFVNSLFLFAKRLG